MTEFDKVLQECLQDLEQGASSVDECLNRHPEHASELRPILQTDAYLDRARELHPSAAFKARVRARLTQDMQAYPRKARMFAFPLFPITRLAASVTIMALAFLITLTVYAQSTLPGQAFYNWKLASENTWRAVSPDPVGTDIAIAQRRVDELLAVQDDPLRYAQAFEAYLEVVARLRSEVDAVNGTRILLALESQMQVLNNSGIVIPQPDQDLPPQFENPLPTPKIPLEAPSATPEILVPTTGPLPTSLLPTAIPTEAVLPTAPNDLPPLVPTLDVPPIQVTPLLP